MAHRTEELLAFRGKHVPKGVGNIYQVFVKEARGALIVDVDGREFIDWAGGIGVTNVGHCNRKVVEAIKDQVEKYLHTCFHVAMYEPYAELCSRLNALAPGDFPKMSLLVNSGAEGVENAVKIARYATRRPGVIVFDNSFHGRTLLTMTMTSKVKPYKFGFGPLAPEVYRAPYAYCYRCPFGLDYPKCGVACADYLELFFISHVAAEQTACIVAEPIQGEGGFVTPPPEYFAKLKAICEKYGILYVDDEVQTGMGRTGKYFAIDHWGVAPDIIITAKSLGGGLPLSAVTGRAEVMDTVHAGGLGGTYGGNPVACRAGLAVLDFLAEPGFLDKAVTLGETLRARLLDLQKRHEIIGDVRGKGPMLAIELVLDRATKKPATAEAKKLTQICFEKGLLVLSCGNLGNVIRTLMPLVITPEQLDRGFAILEAALKEVAPH